MKTTPTFNLTVVIRETGIKPDTLRAWERRYGLPQPSRSEGGHRLYSERDIATIRWLIERQHEGLRIKQAVALWKEIEESGQDPLIVKSNGAVPVSFDPRILGSKPVLDDLRAGWVTACLNFDENAADNIANYAFALYPMESVCFEVLLSGLVEIGEGWYQGSASVQQEHFASSLVIRRLNTMITASPSPTRRGNILIGCPPGDDHTISQLMLTLMLRQRGWRVVYLGANVAINRLEGTIQAVKPSIVVLTAQHLSSAATLLDMAEYLVGIGIQVAFGGLIFNRNPELIARIPGHYLGEHLVNAAQNIEALLAASPTHLAVFPGTPETQKALAYYREMRLTIENAVAEILRSHNINPNYLTIANRFLSQNIEAALRLGNLDFLKSELSWIDELIINYQFKPDTLNAFLEAYLQAVDLNLGERGALILKWLSDLRGIKNLGIQRLGGI